MQYLCRECGKSFVRTTGTALYKSRSGEAAWKQVIRDTINGIPIDQTARGLGMRHQTVFNMRHKALFCLETEPLRAKGPERILACYAMRPNLQSAPTRMFGCVF